MKAPTNEHSQKRCEDCLSDMKPYFNEREEMGEVLVVVWCGSECDDVVFNSYFVPIPHTNSYLVHEVHSHMCKKGSMLMDGRVSEGDGVDMLWYL